jgi:hypothetical protein
MEFNSAGLTDGLFSRAARVWVGKVGWIDISGPRMRLKDNNVQNNE